MAILWKYDGGHPDYVHEAQVEALRVIAEELNRMNEREDQRDEERRTRGSVAGG